jgi:hypothetical protein
MVLRTRRHHLHTHYHENLIARLLDGNLSYHRTDKSVRVVDSYDGKSMLCGPSYHGSYPSFGTSANVKQFMVSTERSCFSFQQRLIFAYFVTDSARSTTYLNLRVTRHYIFNFIYHLGKLAAVKLRSQMKPRITK